MSEAKVVGLLHPGEMGSAVGATLLAGGARVRWASQGRGAALSVGPHVAESLPLFAVGPVTAIALDGPVGAASALKMFHAGWNKGMQALLMSVRALAIAEGVDEALLAQWLISAPELPAHSERAVQDNARKAWRFVGEREGIARSFAQAGLPGGFHEAAGEVYRRLAGYKDGPTPPRVEEAIAALLKRPPRESP